MDFPKSAHSPAKLDYTEFEQAVNAWHENHRTESAIARPVGTFGSPQAPALAHIATSSGSITPLTSHREWRPLTTLGAPAIVAHVNDLIMRCAAANEAFGNALTKLQITTQLFLAKHCPASPEDRAAYFDAFVRAQNAGQAIFAPQKAYRDAIVTFYILVGDLIDVLPDKNALKQNVKSKHNEGIRDAEKNEEHVRGVLRELADKTSKGNESHALLTYLETARQRMKNWKMEEGRLKALAEDVLGAFL